MKTDKELKHATQQQIDVMHNDFMKVACKYLREVHAFTVASNCVSIACLVMATQLADDFDLSEEFVHKLAEIMFNGMKEEGVKIFKRELKSELVKQPRLEEDAG